MLTFAVVVVAVPIVFWAMKMVSLAVWQNKVIYMSWFGGSEYTATPSDLGMDYEDLYITTADGVKINCWLVKQKEDYQDKPTLIYFSGNAGNISHRLEKVWKTFYRGVGCNVLLVSYRGYGRSDGSPSERGLRADAEAAFDYLVSRSDIDKTNIFAYGHSLGCGVAIHLTRATNAHARDLGQRVQGTNAGRRAQLPVVRGLILDNGFTSVSDMVSHIYPSWTPYVIFKSLLLRNFWENEKEVADIPQPLLVLTAPKDTQVPSWMSKKVFDSATASVHKEMHSFEWGTHDDNWKQPQYAATIKRFMELASAADSDFSDHQ